MRATVPAEAQIQVDVRKPVMEASHSKAPTMPVRIVAGNPVDGERIRVYPSPRRFARAHIGTQPCHACQGWSFLPEPFPRRTSPRVARLDRSFRASAVAVEARDLTKRVRDGHLLRTVIDRVSVVVARGELVVLRGPSGSGKTTLLALLGAMLSPTSGEVLVDGEATSRLRDAQRADVRRNKVGFMFQDHQLIDAMSVRENVLLPSFPDGIRADDVRRADALLERFAMRHLASSAASALSGGERQRVALARALVRDPPLVLLDEPTAHLDDERARSVAEILADLAAEGRALVVASHDSRISGVQGVSTVLHLAEGHLVAQAPA
jgi:putative ABC transport system ATP-binding protein